METKTNKWERPIGILIALALVALWISAVVDGKDPHGCYYDHGVERCWIDPRS